MTNTNPIIRRYAAGEISAMQAADLLGVNNTVADVITLLHQAGLPPPEPPLEQQRAELAHARKILGLDKNPILNTKPPLPRASNSVI